MAVPHLGTNLRRDQELQLLQNGDFSDLFGLRVVGAGEHVEEILMAAQSTHPPLPAARWHSLSGRMRCSPR